MLQALCDHFSDKLYPYFWRYRHWWDSKWAESYASQEAIRQPHRKLLMKAVETIDPKEGVLEIGCGGGANLYRLAQKFPRIAIYGSDISPHARKVAEKLTKGLGVIILKPDDRKPDDIELVLTDALLIYKIHPEEITDMICKEHRAYVGCEWHSDCDKSFTFGRHWVHNYRKRFPGCEIQKLTWDVPDEGWDTYGNIITWRK